MGVGISCYGAVVAGFSLLERWGPPPEAKNLRLRSWKLSCTIAHRLGGQQWTSMNYGNYKTLERVVTSDKVLIGGDVNGHAGRKPCGFGEVLGGHRAGLWNDEDVRLINWAVGKCMKLMYTYFQKTIR